MAHKKINTSQSSGGNRFTTGSGIESEFFIISVSSNPRGLWKWCVCVVFHELCPRSWPWTAIKIFSHVYENRRIVDHILEVTPGCHCQISENWLLALTVSRGSRNHTVAWRITTMAHVKSGPRGLASFRCLLIGGGSAISSQTRLNHPNKLRYMHISTNIHFICTCVYVLCISTHAIHKYICAFI